MVTTNTVDFYGKAIDFPVYYVSHPPHRDTLEPIYYKVVSAQGPVFWRTEDADRSRETTLFDMLQEEKSGWGVNELQKEYTPWDESQSDS